MNIRKAIFLYLVLVVSVVAAYAKSKPGPILVMMWPTTEKPTLKLTFAAFNQVGSYSGQLSLASMVTIENVSDKAIPKASFTVYLLDKARVRVGEGILRVNDLGPGQGAKVAFQVNSTGLPETLSLSARKDPAGMPSLLKTIPLKIISTPPGARLKVDGQDEGITPKSVDLSVGIHQVELEKEGFAKGVTPVEINADDLPGGSITIELGGLSRDTVELRDGKVVVGDVLSMSLTAVVMRVDGKDQSYDRNQVKKIFLVERETVADPPVTQPQAATPK